MPKVAAIFVAVPPVTAPKGAARPFSKVENREVMMRTIELYTNRDDVVQKILGVAVDDMQTIQARYAAHLAFQGVSVAAGGPDWFGVVARALEKLKPEIELVLIHDACRPAVPYTLLDALDAAIVKPNVQAVAPTVAVAGSLAKVVNGQLDAALESPSLHEIQTPQIFQKQVILDAYAKRASIKGATDDAQLVRLAGGTVTTITGSEYNVRVDSDEMVKLAQDYLKHMPKPRSKGPLTPFDEAQW